MLLRFIVSIEMHLSNSDPTSASSSSPPLLKLHLLSDSKLSGPLTTQQLSEIWSPSVVLGQVAPPTMDTRNSSRSSVHSHHSDLVSLDSTQATPILLGYSPIVSLTLITLLQLRLSQILSVY